MPLLGNSLRRSESKSLDIRKNVSARLSMTYTEKLSVGQGNNFPGQFCTLAAKVFMDGVASFSCGQKVDQESEPPLQEHGILRGWSVDRGSAQFCQPKLKRQGRVAGWGVGTNFALLEELLAG